MTVYNRQREHGAGCHVNPDEWNIDHRDEPVSLFDSFLAQGLIPSALDCDHDAMQITFPVALTPQQEETMDQVISDHKAVIDWPPSI